MNSAQRQNARSHYEAIRARMEPDGTGDFYVDGPTLFAVLSWLEAIADGDDEPSEPAVEDDKR